MKLVDENESLQTSVYKVHTYACVHVRVYVRT